MAPSAEVVTQLATDEVEAIKELRSLVSDVLTPWYDTDFNLLRWLQSCEFNVSKSAHLLRKHLKWRKERNLDGDCSGLQRSAVTEKYAPLSIIGPNRPGGDRLVIIDRAGRVDVGGVMKSVQPTEYIHQQFLNFEKIQRIFMEMEAQTGVQANSYYIFDMEGLHFDPSLLSVVNGPFRVTWQLTGMHYREFVDKFIVVNSPSYISVLWSALSPFIPEQSRRKIVFTGKDWKDELLELCDPSALPESYGGTLKDDDCLTEVPSVPKDVYWRPKPDYPLAAELHKVSIPAAKHRVLDYKIAGGTGIKIYSMNDSDICFCIQYSLDKDAPEDQWETLMPPIAKCSLPSMDMFDYFCECDGYYHIKLTNEAAWLLPSQFKIIVHDDNGSEIVALNAKEKWIKQGTKAK